MLQHPRVRAFCFISGKTSCDSAHRQLWWETPCRCETKGEGELILMFSASQSGRGSDPAESPRSLPATLLTQHLILRPLYGNTFTIEGPQLWPAHLDSSRVIKTVICFFIPATWCCRHKLFQASLPPSADALIKSISMWSSLCDKVIFCTSA